MTKRLLPTLFIAASLLAGTQPALAGERDAWRAEASGSFVTLAYGPVDRQAHPIFLLSCLNGVGIAVLSVRMEFDEKDAGLPLTIQLSAGGLSAPVAGDTARDETSGVLYGDFGDIAVSPILRVLREKGPVTVTSGDAKTELTDTDRAGAVAKFTEDCTLD